MNSINKWVLIAGAILLGTIAMTKVAPSAELADIPQMQKEMFEPSVQLEKNCSGTIIYSDRDKDTGLVNTVVLTAKHCTEKMGQSIRIVIPTYNKSNRLVNETWWEATVVGISTNSDLAILKFKDQNTIFPAASVAPKATGDSLIFGQDVWSVSYPLGKSQTVTMGTLGRVDKVIPFADLSKSTEFYRSTPDIAPGSSGSGLFQKTTGKYELIGVLTGQAQGFTFINLYTPIEEVSDYLDVVKKIYEVNTKVK